MMLLIRFVRLHFKLTIAFFFKGIVFDVIYSVYYGVVQSDSISELIVGFVVVLIVVFAVVFIMFIAELINLIQNIMFCKKANIKLQDLMYMTDKQLDEIGYRKKK